LDLSTGAPPAALVVTPVKPARGTAMVDGSTCSSKESHF